MFDNFMNALLRPNMMSPQLNFLISCISILVCLIPKIFGINDSFNIDGSNDNFDKESMKTYALLLLLSASPTTFDFVMDMLSGHQNLKKDQEMKWALNLTSLSYILASLDILAKLGYSSIHITPPSFHLSFEFLVWCVRLNTSASLMFVASVRCPETYPAWKTGIVTLTVASYGLLRYVTPSELNLMTSLFYRVLFTTRIVLISCVHYMYCVWVYKLASLRKWTVNDYGIFFNLLVFTLLTLDFIKNGIYKVFFKCAYSAVIHLDKFHVERIMIDLIIAKVMFSVIPGRLAKLEMIEHKDMTIETRKAFVRYISHELRTPLNTVFAGIKLAIQQHKTYMHYESSQSNAFYVSGKSTLSIQESIKSISMSKATRRTSLQSSCSNISVDDERLEILQEISLACGVAVEILNEFLMFDKLEQDSLAINKQDVNVIEFMASAIKMIFVQIREKNIRLLLVNYVSNEDKHIHQDSLHQSTLPEEGEKEDEDSSLLFNQPEARTYDLSKSLNFNPLYDNECYILPTDNILIDKHKLDQVMRNLLSNAIKFTPSGGKITIAIMFKPETTTVTEDTAVTKGSLVIEVTDTGAGISETDQKKLFKEVVQFRPHELQGGGGSGLGLFITKGIVDLHGGSISVSSPGEGLGSTFTLKIPMFRVADNVSNVTTTSSKKTSANMFDLKVIRKESTNVLNQQFTQYEDLLNGKGNIQSMFGVTVSQMNSQNTIDNSASESEIESTEAQSSSPITGTPTLSNKMLNDNYVHINDFSGQIDELKHKNESESNKKLLKFLVVDDSGMNRKMMSRMLNIEGHVTEVADDGIQAVEMFKQHPMTYYDAILMDSHMRQMHGPEATRIIRSLGYSGIILGITGETSEKDIDRFHEYGASNVLLKPVDLDIIKATLKQKKLVL